MRKGGEKSTDPLLVVLNIIVNRFLGRGNFLGAISFLMAKTFPGPMRSYLVKENQISLGVSEIHRQRYF